jgi:ketosteroid isomerase-like protein
MRRSGILVLALSVGLVTVSAVAHNPSSPKQAESKNAAKTQDEKNLEQIESDFSNSEEQNHSLGDAIADDWVGLNSNGREISKAKFAEEMERNRVQHNGPNPYTVQRKNMRIDLFGDTAVVTYVREYHQKKDDSKMHADDFTDVFTRMAGGWKLRFTRVVVIPD